MENEEKGEKDLCAVRDSLRVALRTADLRSQRLGKNFTVGEIARLGIELLYAGELEILRANQERVVFDVKELS